ncbi:MAG: hypothetical protein ACFFB5_12200 [Promethearchaeota archaeon]
MTALNFSVNRCSNNPQRWNVYFNNLKPFHIHSIREILEKKQYQILAATPNVTVFRSKEVRLILHSEGLIQVDLYDSSKKGVKDIEHLIKDIFDFNSINFSGDLFG